MSTTARKPSHFVHHIKVDRGSNWIVFKLNRVLQNRLASLVDKGEQQVLTSDEAAELDAIQELEQIFTYINHQMAHQHRNRLRSS